MKQKSQELEAALGRIVQRKRGTLSNFRRFVDLYQKIMDIDFQAEKRQPVLAVIPLNEEDFAGLQQMVLIPKRAFTVFGGAHVPSERRPGAVDVR